MLEKAVEYIRANPSMILWVLVILTVAVIYLYYVAYLAHGEGFTKKKGGRKSKRGTKKRRDEDEEDAVDLNDDLPEPEETNARISRDRLDELSML